MTAGETSRGHPPSPARTAFSEALALVARKRPTGAASAQAPAVRYQPPAGPDRGAAGDSQVLEGAIAAADPMIRGAPMIGLVTSVWASIHASATCAGVTPRSVATSVRSDATHESCRSAAARTCWRG